ncbi:hypothetical protein [Daejeonella sp.]|uniref:hypothetical protein n=1 Tax=Daejeonella sp. TaxID=2805397 RepID=UPI00398379C6
MKKIFILTTMVLGLFTACSSNANKETEAESGIAQEQMKMSADSTNSAFTDSAKAAKDSADAAHGHSH